MKSSVAARLVGAVLMLAGCQMAATPQARPAVLLQPDAAARQELHDTLLHMSGFARASLLDSALTQDSELVLERLHQRDDKGELIQGRDLERPQRFQLQSQEGQCWLVQLASGKRQRLYQARCQPRLP